MTHHLECLNPVFNTVAPGAALNGKILRLEKREDVKAFHDPSVSAVILDVSSEPAVQAFMRMVANKESGTSSLLGRLKKVCKNMHVKRDFNSFLLSIFPQNNFNGHPLSHLSLGEESGVVKGRSIRFNEYAGGKFKEYSVMVANLGAGKEAGAGTKYLLSPVTETRYRSDIEGRPWPQVARNNPDLDWGELKPGEIMLYKGGQAGVRPVLISGGPDVSGDKRYAYYEMSDQYIPVPPLG